MGVEEGRSRWYGYLLREKDEVRNLSEIEFVVVSYYGEWERGLIKELKKNI